MELYLPAGNDEVLLIYSLLIRSSCVNAKDPFALYYSQLESIEWHVTEAGIQSAIYSHGPLVSCFHVYADFMSYKSGVYVHKNGSFVGGHCIKIVGWDTDPESGLDYWIVQNR